jgi:hypothetical protein
LLDPAAFHQVLSNALLNITSRCAENNTRETNDCIKHHALAVKLVNERISDKQFAISDGFIGAIIGFACYYVGNIKKLEDSGADLNYAALYRQSSCMEDASSSR